MTDRFYHVVAAVGDHDVKMFFSDLTAAELEKKFVMPYKRGKTFFVGAQLINPSELRMVRIIETPMPEDEARKHINKESLSKIDEMNRMSGVMIISAGQGYEPEDLVAAGTDVTRRYLTDGPGSSTRLWGLSKTVVGWSLGIVAAVIATGLAKWLGWA